MSDPPSPKHTHSSPEYPGNLCVVPGQQSPWCRATPAPATATFKGRGPQARGCSGALATGPSPHGMGVPGTQLWHVNPQGFVPTYLHRCQHPNARSSQPPAALQVEKGPARGSTAFPGHSSGTPRQSSSISLICGTTPPPSASQTSQEGRSSFYSIFTTLFKCRMNPQRLGRRIVS